MGIEYIQIKNNIPFEHFFRNSFHHFYLRTPEMQDLPRQLRTASSREKADHISENAQFLVAVDKLDTSVFYSYIAYAIFDDSLYLYFAYTKKEFRNFGFFTNGLQILEKDISNFYYLLPVRVSKHSALDRYELRLL